MFQVVCEEKHVVMFLKSQECVRATLEAQRGYMACRVGSCPAGFLGGPQRPRFCIPAPGQFWGGGEVRAPCGGPCVRDLPEGVRGSGTRREAVSCDRGSPWASPRGRALPGPRCSPSLLFGDLRFHNGSFSSSSDTEMRWGHGE